MHIHPSCVSLLKIQQTTHIQHLYVSFYNYNIVQFTNSLSTKWYTVAVAKAAADLHGWNLASVPPW